MREKLLSSVSALSLNDRRQYYQIEAFFPEQAVYIRLLDADDPLRQGLPSDVPIPEILYVLCTKDGDPIGVSDDRNRLEYNARNDEKILFTLH